MNHELIRVLSLSGEGYLRPLSFARGEVRLLVRRINARWQGREGKYTLYYYALTAEDEKEYEIVFSTQNLHWYLRRAGERWC